MFSTMTESQPFQSLYSLKGCRDNSFGNGGAVTVKWWRHWDNHVIMQLFSHDSNVYVLLVQVMV